MIDRMQTRPALNIAMIASECVPFASSGGLGDVVDALPRALKPLANRVIRILPAYRRILESDGWTVEPIGGVQDLRLGEIVAGAEYFRLHLPDGHPDREVETYLVHREEFFDRAGLYGTRDREYQDNAERFIYFQKAAVRLLGVLFEDAEHPLDRVHLHDWQTGFVPWFLRFPEAVSPTRDWHRGLRNARTLFTIHNLAYQGIFPAGKTALLNLPGFLFNPEQFEFYGQLNSLKAGLTGADRISTVSPSYAREIQTEEHGCGLEGVLRQRSNRLDGILNGVDTDSWNPATDPHLPATYSPEDLQGKTVCRKALGREFKLPIRAGDLVIGMVSRLTEQKGFAILRDALPELVQRPVRIALLGSGDREWEAWATESAAKYPEAFSVHLAFSPQLARLVEAGSDVFLMPSRFEPCGLNQMYSLLYGTPPIVNPVGGLADTVTPLLPGSETQAGNGFHMDAYKGEALIKAIDHAIALRRNRKLWKIIQQRGMCQPLGWNRAATEYLNTYQLLGPHQTAPSKNTSPNLSS